MINNSLKLVWILFVSTTGLVTGQTENEIENYTVNREDRLSWWKDARYGMFIHWGVYAELAGEWKDERIEGPGEWIMYNAKIPVEEYEKVAGRFNPGDFNAEKWVRVARDAGMKYIVITAKHCDGFAMYHSKVSNYNIVDFTQFKRDPVRELKAACDKYGIKLGFYYSHNWDWHEPNAKGLANTWDFPDTESKDPGNYYKNKSIPQIEELVKNYSPDIMWFDVPTDIPRETSFEILKKVRKVSPDCIINDRISSEHGEKKLVMGDYYTPEQYIPAGLEMDFETCMTLNDTWGYKYYDHNWKSAGMVIKNLIMNASMGGNYLLNVGPDDSGEIPSRSVVILKTAGEWLNANGESIYGTSRSPLKHVFYDQGACTAKPGKLYIHLFEWPEKRELVLPEINANVDRIYLQADQNKKPLSFKKTGKNDLIIDLEPEKIGTGILSNMANTLVIKYSGTLQPQKLPGIIDPFNTATFTASNASFSGNASYEFNNRWGEHRGYEMTEWNNGGAVSWDFRTIRNGSYKIELVYGSNEKSIGSDIHISIDGKTFKHKINEQQGWYRSKRFKIGEIHLPEGISGEIKVTAGWSLSHTIANLMQIRIMPICEN